MMRRLVSSWGALSGSDPRRDRCPEVRGRADRPARRASASGSPCGEGVRFRSGTYRPTGDALRAPRHLELRELTCRPRSPRWRCSPRATSWPTCCSIACAIATGTWAAPSTCCSVCCSAPTSPGCWTPGQVQDLTPIVSLAIGWLGMLLGHLLPAADAGAAVAGSPAHRLRRGGRDLRLRAGGPAGALSISRRRTAGRTRRCKRSRSRPSPR